MKPRTIITFLILSIFFIIGCERERTNPWDIYATLNPEAWAPQNLQIEELSIIHKKLTWTYQGDERVEGFKIDRKEGSDPWQLTYRLVDPKTRNWIDSAIVPNSAINYSYRVYTCAGQHNSAERTESDSARFPAPKNFQTEKLSDKSYKLTWIDNSTGEQGFKIDRKIDENNWVIAYGTVAQNQTSYTDTNVFRATNVEYRVYAFYESYESSKITTNTNSELTAPTDLNISNNSITSVTLNWQYNSSGEDGFKIERKYEGGSWESLATVTANSFEDNNFDLNTQVYYRVCAFVGTYNSSWTQNDFDAAIPQATNFEVTTNNIRTITLNWQDKSTGEDGFKIERKYEGGNWESLATATANNYEDNNFDLNTQVYYRVCAYVGTYNSAWAETDFDATIPPPENLQITANSASSVTINWDFNLNGHDGFQIDRKINDGAWLEDFATLNAGQNSYVDEAVDLFENSYTYRIYAYVNIYESGKTEMTINKIEIGSIIFGSIVFYLDGNGGGLVCTESDQSTSTEWGCYGTTIGGTSTGIGTGAANTAAILTGCSETRIAARICDELVLNGFSDWFLPSKEELNLMYENLKLNGIGGFAADNYWSSSEDGPNNAWKQSFDLGYQGSGSKANYERVRAVRAL